MEYIKRAPRRSHSEELRLQVLAACAQPGASVAAVALAHGLNANLVRKWRKAGATATPRPTKTGRDTRQFVAVSVTQPVRQPSEDIRIELRKGAMVMAITWPSTAANDCAAWMRELLR